MNQNDPTLDSFTPAYLDRHVRDSLPQRACSAVESLGACRVCPRACNVDRLADERKVCHTGRFARVTSAFPHFGEEDCLRGTHGSGTIFFARCNLRCVFCQNWEISHADSGRECTPEEIARLMLDLQDRGCHNINFVTPEHVVPQVIEAIGLAVDGGLKIPIVYNTSAYDSMVSLRQLDGLIDIYMPDFKLFSPDPCARYLGAKDYGRIACEAIAEMHRQVGDLKLNRDGIACRGLMIRHLVMPNLLDETRKIMQWLADLSRDTFVNIMGQYHPDHWVTDVDPETRDRYELINRRPTRDELAEAYRAAREAGLWRFDNR